MSFDDLNTSGRENPHVGDDETIFLFNPTAAPRDDGGLMDVAVLEAKLQRLLEAYSTGEVRDASDGRHVEIALDADGLALGGMTLGDFAEARSRMADSDFAGASGLSELQCPTISGSPTHKAVVERAFGQLLRRGRI